MADWKIGDPVPKRSEEEVRRRFGDWMRRRREAAGYSQVEAALNLAVSQSKVSRCEGAGVASEEVLERMWVLYGVPEPYPDAPRDPIRRRAWFHARNTDPRFFPRAQTTGSGKPPSEVAA